MTEIKRRTKTRIVEEPVPAVAPQEPITVPETVPSEPEREPVKVP